jgi:hypothetical protein
MTADDTKGRPSKSFRDQTDGTAGRGRSTDPSWCQALSIKGMPDYIRAVAEREKSIAF